LWGRPFCAAAALPPGAPVKSGYSLRPEGSVGVRWDFRMIDPPQASGTLPIALKERLTAEDDPALWERVLQILAEDASAIESIKNGSQLYTEVGSCSHWLRPHQTRWTAAGGFAWPTGYGGSAFSRTGLPGFDWSVTLQFTQAPIGWVIPEGFPTKRPNSLRAAIPSRTTRHRQAAVHTLWPAGTLNAKKRTVFYGFRNVNGVWELKACSR